MAVRLVLAGVIVGLFISAQPAGHANTLSPAQAQLQRILSHRHYWQHRLKQAKHQEHALQQRLEVTQGQLGSQRQRLQNEQDRAAAQRDHLLSAITADEQRIATLRSKVDRTRSSYRRVHREAEGLLARLRHLKVTIHQELGHVREAVVQMYDLSQVPPLEQVLEAHSLTDLLKQQSFVTEIGDHDRSILQRARAQHEAVYRVAKVYINRMHELRALQAQEKAQLQLVIVATKREDVLLIRAQRLTQHRQASIRQTEASIQALGNQEQRQLEDVASAAQSDSSMIWQDQQAAQRVAVIIGEQTGSYPNVGSPPGMLMWPLTGVITQGFGPSPYAFEPPLTYHGTFYPHFHTGLDIAAPFQAPIRAAAAGRVIFAALSVPGQPHLAYGLNVIIMHTPHLATLYGHLDDGLGLRVHQGQVVAAGQVIGYEGMTGNTTGPHLHFEVRVNGDFVNPLGYLPRNQS